MSKRRGASQQHDLVQWIDDVTDMYVNKNTHTEGLKQ